MKKKYLLLLIPFLFLSKVNASMIGDYSFLGYKLDDEFVISSNSSKTGSIYFYNTIENNSTSSSNYFYIDLCTTGNEPTLWITANSSGTMSPSTKWYKLDTACSVSGYRASVYRQIVYLGSSYQWGSCAVDGVSTKCSENNSTGRLFSNTSYNVYMRVLHIGISPTIPLDEIILQENQTQNDLLNDIKNSFSSQNSTLNDIQQNTKDTKDAINETNDTLKNDDTQEAQDSAGGFFNDFTTDTHGLTAVITAPLSLITSITSSSCSPLVIPLPYVDKDLTLPCMGTIYSNYFGSFLSIYQMLPYL